MNIREGARRMQYIGRITLSITAFAFVLAVVDAVIGQYTSRLPFPFSAAIIVLCVYSAIIGSLFLIFLIAGWIVKGFAEPLRNTAPDEPAGD